MLTIVDLNRDAQTVIESAARVLVAGFAKNYPESWPTFESGLDEVKDCLESGFVRVCLDESGAVLGWIGGRSEYNGHVWELHPLVVDPTCQERGIGRALVEDFEQQVAARGGITIMLGTDDEDNRTSLGGAEVYPDIWRQIKEIKNIGRHPFGFYQKLGYVVMGIVPDANGYGKPDILMAKRVRHA